MATRVDSLHNECVLSYSALCLLFLDRGRPRYRNKPTVLRGTMCRLRGRRGITAGPMASPYQHACQQRGAGKLYGNAEGGHVGGHRLHMSRNRF